MISASSSGVVANLGGGLTKKNPFVAKFPEFNRRRRRFG
jgi:hypothetical protein